jgi:hypothetical protein
MADFVEVRRVVVIADRLFERQLLDDFVKLGVAGWTISYCAGKGVHAIMDDPFSQPDRSRVRIEILASPAIAEAMMHRVEKTPYNLRRVIAFMDNVKVSGRRKFA